MTQSMFLVVALLAVVVVAIVLRGAAGKGPETQLLRVCRGDADQAERLLQSELNRSPGLSRKEAAARAVARVERDNR